MLPEHIVAVWHLPLTVQKSQMAYQVYICSDRTYSHLNLILLQYTLLLYSPTGFGLCIGAGLLDAWGVLGEVRPTTTNEGEKQ